MRPKSVVRAYWEEVIVVEEDAIFYDQIYFTFLGCPAEAQCAA